MLELMTDHPGWLTGISGKPIRVMRNGSSVWWIRDETPTQPLPQHAVWQMPHNAPHVPTQLNDALQQLGPVLRYRNHDLWDALVVAIIRQVVRANQARKLYAKLCHQHGQRITHNGEEAWLSPSPQTILQIAGGLEELGLKFHRPKLLAAALAYTEHGDNWQTLPPPQLVQELRLIAGIGPWTAGAAVADFTHDWTLYPYGDLAIRTWVGRAAPSVNWETKEARFAEQWAAMTKPNLSTLTVLVLAYGGIHSERRSQ
jgi:DNA-3-methyladenine glycosylase II